ncbi:hypothetical protein ACH5RR_023244 [Cinchona calisaya]|uniref:Retrotransposon gag domain-containing protein n=1 Tax=Cinchona calisaya TaxID=153742 RepID=A0ABD2ZA45_9GENT
MPIDHEFLQRMERFDDFIKESQGMDKYGGIAYDDLCFFSNAQLPPKFKIPDFAKYDGNGDPIVHLKMFCNLLGKPTDDPRVAIRLFGTSLEGDALEWFLKLDFKRLRMWSDLASVFVKQYEFNRDLMNMSSTKTSSQIGLFCRT